MKKRTFRWGWLMAVGAMTALACTCGALGQAQQAAQTAQAVASQAQGFATQAQGFATEAQGFATEFEESGFEETAQAVGTESGGDGGVELGDIPEDVPVFPQNDNMFALEGVVTFFSSSSFQEVVDFYKQEMPNNGWAEASSSVETSESAVLNYSKDGRTATVTINDIGGQVSVVIATDGN